MSKQKAKGLTGDFLKRVNPEPETPGKPVAMTLKLPQADYERLKAVAVKRRSKGQAIMLEAVRQYLDSIGA